MADASKKKFRSGLRAVKDTTGLSITFADITNLVEYRSLRHKPDREFLQKLPLAQRALVLFSSHKNCFFEDTFPTCRLAVGRQNLQNALSELEAISWQKVNHSRKVVPKELVWID